MKPQSLGKPNIKSSDGWHTTNFCHRKKYNNYRHTVLKFSMCWQQKIHWTAETELLFFLVPFFKVIMVIYDNIKLFWRKQFDKLVFLKETNWKEKSAEILVPFTFCNRTNQDWSNVISNNVPLAMSREQRQKERTNKKSHWNYGRYTAVSQKFSTKNLLG